MGSFRGPFSGICSPKKIGGSIRPNRRGFNANARKPNGLLHEQRALIDDPAISEQTDCRPENRDPLLPLPPELIAHYRELLRTYVIMGSGNLACELRRLAELLATAGLNRSADRATASSGCRGTGPRAGHP